MPEALNQTITVTLPDGTAFGGKYELRTGEITGLDDLACKAETGMTVWGLIRTNGSEDGYGLLLAVVVAWLVRRKDFPHTTFEQIASSVSWGKDFEILWNAGDKEGEGPGSEPSTPKSSEPSPTSTESTRGKSTS